LLASLLALVCACGSDGGSGTDAATGSGDGSNQSIDASGGGCGGSGAATGVINGTINVSGTDRTYILSVPASYDSAQPYKLIFAWHGRTGTSSTARLYFGIEAAAGANAIVVYPQGLLVSSTPGDYGWELTASGRDVALYDALSAKLAADYCIGTTYSMGHSFGGYMSNSLACYRGGSGPGKIRAIAPVAGGGPFGACSGDPVSAVITHGSNDMVVDITQGEGSRDTWRADAGCATTSTSITPSPCIAYDACNAGLDVRWCQHADTANSGHGWPSFAAAAAWQLFTDAP